MHICISSLNNIGSDNGLLLARCQAIIWTNAVILLIGPLGANFSEISIKIKTFSFKKMHLKISSRKCRPFCPDLNVITHSMDVPAVLCSVRYSWDQLPLGSLHIIWTRSLSRWLMATTHHIHIKHILYGKLLKLSVAKIWIHPTTTRSVSLLVIPWLLASPRQQK